MTTITQIRGAADWRSDRILDDGQWKFALTGAHRAELLNALATVHSIDAVSRESFELPTAGPEFQALAADVSHGRGFVLLQGVPVEGLTEAECEILSVGIASHFGRLVPQGSDGAPMLHVRDQGVDPSRPMTKSYQHSQRLGFHADPTDIVALLCVRPAKSGGLSSIVSSLAVHNEIVRTRPDLAGVLYQPWWFDRRAGDGPDSFFQQPVYEVGADGGFVSRYGPDYMRSAQRGARVPPLSPVQLEAMDLLDQLNNDPRFVLTIDLRAGDMQFLSNSVILHSRTAYQDHPEPERRRDLIRLWLDDDCRSPGVRSLPVSQRTKGVT